MGIELEQMLARREAVADEIAAVVGRLGTLLREEQELQEHLRRAAERDGATGNAFATALSFSDVLNGGSASPTWFPVSTADTAPSSPCGSRSAAHPRRDRHGGQLGRPATGKRQAARQLEQTHAGAGQQAGRDGRRPGHGVGQGRPACGGGRQSRPGGTLLARSAALCRATADGAAREFFGSRKRAAGRGHFSF
jgi:hypothetical protein